MATYYVDDGGSATAPYDTWAKAALTVGGLGALASSDIVYIGHNTVQTQASALTITGPTSGLPVYLISATQGSSPPTYQAGTTNQIETTGANAITFDGSFAMYGIRCKSGANIVFGSDTDEIMLVSACTLAPAANGQIVLVASGGANTKVFLHNNTVDLTADGTTNRSADVITTVAIANASIRGLAFVNAGYRTGAIFGTGGVVSVCEVSGADFSGFTNATPCEIVSLSSGAAFPFSFADCKMAATWTPSSTPTPYGSMATFVNCGSANAPTYLSSICGSGSVISTTSIYRTSGAQIGSTNVGWLITTTATCGEGAPFYTPWIYSSIASTGSKTFDLYITNDVADLTDAECWLEVEYLATSGSGQWTLASDQRTITTTAAAQTDDTSSTWNGSGPAFTYKQKLSVTATIGQAGQFRCRVAVGKASIASSAYFYVDPAVTVT